MPYVETIDISDAFSDIIGASIEKISFDDNEGTDGFQPIVLLHMNSGKGITFSLNFKKNNFRYRVEKNYKYWWNRLTNDFVKRLILNNFFDTISKK